MQSNVDEGNFGLKPGENYKIARNCLTYMLDFIVMEMNKVNREKGYCLKNCLNGSLRKLAPGLAFHIFATQC